MMASEKQKTTLLLLAKVLLLIGGVNWGVTALRMRQDDTVRDLLQFLHEKANVSLPIGLTKIQQSVYVAVALSALVTASQMRQ